MATESDGGGTLEILGGLIAHAQTAQAALDEGIEAHTENTEAITALIQQAAAVIQKLQAEVQKLGPRAEQAGAAAVREAVQQNLAGAGAIVADAARTALAPVMNDTLARAEAARRAGDSLDRQAEKFSNRMLAIVAGAAIGALVLAGLGVRGALAWQRSDLASLGQEKTALQAEIAAMNATAQKMRADGLKIEFGTCAETNGRQRRCVAGQPGAQRWGTEQAPFYVLKGY